ncbi:MAG: exosortase, PEP-CTERM interaction domain protein [Cyanobacteria bacterium P01_F01_bin.150]
MNGYHRYVLIPLLTTGIIGLAANDANALSIEPNDFDALVLGPKIVGPVGPTVDTAFISSDDNGVGDLVSSVSCPVGFTACTPPTNPADTLYTYVHEITPGVDFPNDTPPFTTPASVLSFDGVHEFSLTFAAEGFTGIAGYSFSEATAALGNDDGFAIEQLDDKTLRWRVSGNSGWGTGETITFFWQTTQSPSGPQGIYSVANSNQSGVANGPIPTPVPVATNPDDVAIPETPISLLSTTLALGGVLTFSKFRKRAAK